MLPKNSREVYEYDLLSGTTAESFRDALEFRATSRATVDDVDVPYISNSHGFRGPELKHAELVAVGCSQTYGVGVLEEETWPSVLASELGVSYVNLGIPGGSIQSIVETAIAYVKTYGAPKIMCVVLPGLYRTKMAFNRKVLDAPKNLGINYSSYPEVYVADVDLSKRYVQETRPSLSKAPHQLTDVIPMETILYFGLVSIKHLIEYCSIAGIDLHISTWRPDTQKTMAEMLPDMFLEFDNIEYFLYGSSELHCHRNDLDNPRWDIGSDRSRHAGVHQHIHYSELFKNAIKRRKNGI